MATSGSSDFNLNRNEIIEEAFSLLGVISDGESLDDNMKVRGDRALNLLVKDWQKDVDLWIETRGTLTAVVDKESYTMGSGGDFTSRPLRIIDMQFRQSSSDIPMIHMSRQEYYELSLKSSTGIPTNFYYDPQLTTGKLFVWPTLASGNSGTFEFTFARSLEDFDASTDDPDFPQEWLLALSFNLARILGSHYGGLTGEIRDMAITLKAGLQMWDEEGASVFLQPDMQ